MSARRPLALAAALLLAGCGGPSSDAPPAVDSTLVALLADVHLADARAALDPTAADPAALADSLREAAVSEHGLSPEALDACLDALARDPALARATYQALEERLTAESFGSTPPPIGGDE